MAAGSASPEIALACDGCGRLAGAKHLRERILRLELQTRFRPVHISTLLLAESPPARMEDWFYFIGEGERSARAQALFDDVLAAAGVAGEGNASAARLPEFQRRGLFLATCVECPLGDEPGGFAAQLGRRAATLVKRIQFSYKPRHIALLSAGTAPVIPILEAAGLGGLLAGGAAPAELPEPSDAAARARFRAQLARVLAESTAPQL